MDRIVRNDIDPTNDAAYCSQIAYLFERLAFYRARLSGAGFDSPKHVGGLADIARLPFT